jgi:alcohol dehydrogenase class IV
VPAGLRAPVWMRALGAVWQGRARSVARHAVSREAAALRGRGANRAQSRQTCELARFMSRGASATVTCQHAMQPQGTQPWPHTLACATPVRHVWRHARMPGLSASAWSALCAC